MPKIFKWKAQDLKAGNVCPEPTTQYTGNSIIVKFQSIPKTALADFLTLGLLLWKCTQSPGSDQSSEVNPMQVSFSPISCPTNSSPIRSSKFLFPSPGSTRTLLYTWVHLPIPEPEKLFSVSQRRMWCSPPMSRSTEPHRLLSDTWCICPVLQWFMAG